MITTQTTKRAAKILADQKSEYERKFKSAKGDSKAIAKVAAEYRSEYGKTPLKRWHKALSQAAKETATHTRPIKSTKSAPANKPKKTAPVAKTETPKPVAKTAPKEAVRKPAKAPLKPKHKLPLLVISKGVLKTVDFERQDPHVVYLNGWTESNGEVCYYYARNGKRVSLKLPESELEKDFVILTKEEAQKRRVAHNKYWEESKRRGEQERAALAAKRKADEKAEKEKFKVAHKTNPDWIKDFAKQTGVSQAVIKAMYAICDNPSRKEDLKLRPVLGGIYCDPDGHLVATDAFILVSLEAKVPKQLAGKILLKSGQTQEGKYPNYKVILEHKELLPNGKHRVRPYIENKDRKTVQTLTDNWGNKYFNACGGRWREDMYRLILNVFEALGETPKAYHVDAEKEAKYKVANEAFYKDVEFNSIKAKLQATLPMSYISKRVNAIQMPLAQ